MSEVIKKDWRTRTPFLRLYIYIGLQGLGDYVFEFRVIEWATGVKGSSIIGVYIVGFKNKCIKLK